MMILPTSNDDDDDFIAWILGMMHDSNDWMLFDLPVYTQGLLENCFQRSEHGHPRHCPPWIQSNIAEQWLKLHDSRSESTDIDYLCTKKTQ